ncbi:hypothetical protein [Enterobacter roggenkampii]|uniref:hypothetical protein n=1 Tax=Enterobacter roggenkampii TaxID=1812935 RepID=UPI001644F7DD|nr:hypothetical protein [Enterobacter roggenkampii]
MKREKIILKGCVFTGVLAAGFFVALAGGVQWGTFDAGCMAISTILCAAVLSFVQYN